MKESGYSEKFRRQIIQAGLAGWDKMQQVAAEGGRPVNRPASWNAEERAKEKIGKSMMWHKKGGYDVPIFIPCTPGSELARKIKAMEEMTGKGKKRSFRVRVVETGGISLRQMKKKMYAAFTPSSSHASHVIAYVTLLLPQSPPPSALHGKQSGLPHFCPDQGSAFCSIWRRDRPPVSTTLTLKLLFLPPVLLLGQSPVN